STSIRQQNRLLCGNIDPSPRRRRPLDCLQYLADVPALLEVAVGAAILGDGAEPLVHLDDLELMNAERDAGDRPERAVIAMRRTQLDLPVALSLGRVTDQVEPQRVYVLLHELKCAFAPDYLDALMPGAAGGDSR